MIAFRGRMDVQRKVAEDVWEAPPTATSTSVIAPITSAETRPWVSLPVAHGLSLCPLA